MTVELEPEGSRLKPLIQSKHKLEMVGLLTLKDFRQYHMSSNEIKPPSLLRTVPPHGTQYPNT